MALDSLQVRRALENEELEPCFQPLVELRTGRLAGFEVLARWRHPEFGLVLPENFISLADENGLIGDLMEQILRKAFLSASLFPEPLSLAVNASPTQLRDLNLPRQIENLANQARFSLERLTIEVTESALLGNLDRAKAIAVQLKAMGCKLALDDFGTGYSSLGHLQALPFDELKIDRSFVASMTKTRESRKIVAATVGLGHSLGLTTVAEGIETEQQADMLLWLGCEIGQGWLYGKGVPIGEVSAIVEAPPRAISAGLSTPGDGWAVSSLEALPAQHLAQLQAIYDGAPVGLCFLDRDLRYVSLNQRLADMNGASIAAHMGRTVQEMIPESFPALEPYLLRALKGEAVSEVEVTRSPNVPGEENWAALLSYQPALDEADEVIGISVAVSDITEHKRTQEALRARDERDQAATEPTDPKSWIMDSEGNNLHMSSRWVQTTELSRKKMRNLGWLEALHPDDLESTMKIMKEALRSGNPIDIEYRVRNLDGDWKWMRSRGSARLSPTAEIIRWYGAVEEIDESRRTIVAVD
ncbi:EAL domain-containing protein [Acidicapsa ligni]|uniref:EAL domain-containing protein n=1 Tax=Acidicapsa ligni TaxID=542300 RepID=UPI0021E004A2|nr:EAL domain-containing protein [Acidicapsa ligni]